MKKVSGLVFATVFLLNLSSHAQTWEIGLSGGVSYYVGDLNPTGHFFFPCPAGSVFGKRILDDRWSVRFGFSYFGARADDRDGSFAYQQVRDLRFQSHIFELHSAVELNFFPFKMREPKTKKWTPYLMAGLGVYYSEPYGAANGGNLVALRPLGTEGQGTDSFDDREIYSPVMPCMPFGLGFKFNIADKMTIALEYSMRLTFNDYLDDVSKDYAFYNEIVSEHGAIAGQMSDMSKGDYAAMSNDLYQRGIKTDLDWYGYLGVSLIWYIKDPRTCPGINKFN